MTHISILYCSVHGGERKKHRKRTKAPLKPTLSHGRGKQDDKIMGVQLEKISNGQGQSSETPGLDTYL